MQRQSGDFWDAAKVTEIKRARRKEAAMDNEKRQKDTKLFKRVFNRVGWEQPRFWGRGNKGMKRWRQTEGRWERGNVCQQGHCRLFWLL